MTLLAAEARQSSRLHAVLLIGATGASAASPIATQILAAHSESLPTQAAVALCLTFCAYGAQILTSFFVEAPLASHAVSAPHPPRWIWIVGLCGAVGLLLGGSNHVVLIASLAASLPVLELGRSAAIAQGRSKSEILAALALSCAVVAGYTLATLTDLNPWLALGAGHLLVHLCRFRTFGSWSSPPRRVALLLMLDTAVTGVTMPVLLLLVASIGNAQAVVAVRALLSLALLLSPAAGYLRLRLLSGRAARRELESGVALVVIAAAATGVVAATPLLSHVFRGSWSAIPYYAVVFALMWRLASCATTFPFARLRVAGRVKNLAQLRLLSTGAYLSLTTTVTWFGHIGLISVGLLAAELVTFVLYSGAARR